MTALIKPAVAKEAEVVDFRSGSSPMLDKDAFGHLAEKLSSMRDALRCLAFAQPFRGKTPRRTLAFVLDQMTGARDALRAVGLLRGNERWIALAGAMQSLRDHLQMVALADLRRWPTKELLEVSGRLELMRRSIEKMKHLREGNGSGWSGGGE